MNGLTTEVNCETGEVIERSRTVEEQAEIDKIRNAEQARVETEAAKTTQRQALLNKLGITEDEARLLLGGTN